jgi:hypothetical protein
VPWNNYKLSETNQLQDAISTIAEDHFRVTECRVTIAKSLAALLSKTRGRQIAAAHKKEAVSVRIEPTKGTATTTPVPPAIAGVERGVES